MAIETWEKVEVADKCGGEFPMTPEALKPHADKMTSKDLDIIRRQWVAQANYDDTFPKIRAAVRRFGKQEVSIESGTYYVYNFTVSTPDASIPVTATVYPKGGVFVVIHSRTSNASYVVEHKGEGDELFIPGLWIDFLVTKGRIAIDLDLHDRKKADEEERASRLKTLLGPLAA